MANRINAAAIRIGTRFDSNWWKPKDITPSGLDYASGTAITIHMLIFQSHLLIFRSKLSRTTGALHAGLAAALLATTLSGCSNSTSKAYAEAQNAQALLDAGDLVGAKLAMARALAIRDDQIDLLLLDGRIKVRMKDFPAAFDSYNLALAIDPNQPEALQGVSQIGASLGRERESNEATDRILALNPSDAPALLVKGIQQLTLRKFAEAQASGEALLKIDPRSEGGQVLRARAIFMLGRQAEALTLLREAAKTIGSTQMIVTALLECARDEGDSQLMFEQFRLLSQLIPHNVDLTLDEANVAYKRGDRDLARSRDWALITENGDDYEAMRRLSEFWTEYDAAPLDAGRIDTLATEGAVPARLMAARHYLGVGDTATAAKLVGSLLGYDAAGLRVRIGFAKGETGSVGAAEQVLAADKTNCDALVVRAAEAMRAKRPADAVIAAQVIAAECSDRDDGFVLLAEAYQSSGNDAGVRRAYLEGIRVRPLSTLLVRRYVDWLIAKDRGDSAVDFARRLTQRAPAKVSAWKLFESTCSRVPGSDCIAEARDGGVLASKDFVIDLPPGERRTNPLLGNSWR
jgi:tetratricopeptide (TPR) repeat protein